MHGCTCLEIDTTPGFKIDVINCPIHGTPEFLAPDAGFTYTKPASKAPTLPGMAYVSAAGFLLYEAHPPIQESPKMRDAIVNGSLRRSSQVSAIATIFAGETVHRDTPPLLYGGDENFRTINAHAYVAAPATRIPACALSLFRKATVQNALVYLDDSEACSVIYEMHRPNDRASSQIDEQIHARERQKLPQDGRAYVLIVSAGSHNWGHWLTDDLPRVAAAVFLRKEMPERRLTIVLLSFGPQIDEARRQSIACHPDLGGVDVAFIERFVAYQFDEIYYATPVSYHPTLKLRAAIDFVRSSYRSLNGGSRKLYITRPAHDRRGLANAAEVEAHMTDMGFEVVECSTMSFEAQVKLFGEAGIVVGLMGAAMTNTMFSPSGIGVIYLACEGWMEPYYWDLADACGQRCAYVFGPTAEIEPVPAHFSRFTIDTADIDQALASIEATL